MKFIQIANPFGERFIFMKRQKDAETYLPQKTLIFKGT